MQKEIVENLIVKIAGQIKNEVKQSAGNLNNDWGLYSGLLGEIVFLYYYSAYTDNESDKNLADEVLDSYLSSIRIGRIGFSLCSGAAGVLYGLKLLGNNNYADVNLNSIIPLFRESIMKNLKTDEDHCNYDLMYGLSGIGSVCVKLGLTDIAEAIAERISKQMIETLEDCVNCPRCVNSADHSMGRV